MTALHVFVCLFLATAVLANANSSPQRVVMEAGFVSSAPEGWQHVGFADAKQSIRLILSVRSSGTEAMLSALEDVSDPNRRDTYGQHLSWEQVNHLMRPTAEASATVASWLHEHNVPFDRTVSGEYLVVDTTVGIAESLFTCRYSNYKHEPSKKVVTLFAPGTGYSLPADVANHVEFVSPSYRFPRVRSVRLNRSRNVGNGTLFVTPDWLHDLYQVPNITSSVKGNAMGVISMIQQFYSPNDLQEFYELFKKDQVGQTVAQQIGANDYQTDGVGLEASLDVQYLSSVGSHVPMWVWYINGTTDQFLHWVVAASNRSDIPQVFSASYGEPESSVSRTYALSVCSKFGALGARGVSVMVASGDSGASCNDNGTAFVPDFPAACPYITSVGGMVGGDAGKTPTGEVGDVISSGGFSNYFDRPSWQKAAVAKYFKTTKLPDSKFFNSTGAGFPQVSAQSEAFTIVSDGIPVPEVGGTSCASPTFSGVVALLNNLRVSNGKSPLGFLNPLIFSTAASVPNAFNDATSGVNEGCDLFGFDANVGWDPVTGVGSPNYRILAGLVMDLP